MACGVLAAVGGDPAAGAAPAVSAPALVAAALVSANRGSMPQTVFIGTETAFGNTAPLQVLLWYVRAPLVVCGLLAPALHTWAGEAAGHRSAPAAGWVAAATAVAFLWAPLRARRLYRG